MAAFTALSGWAEVAAAPPHMAFPLPEQLDFAEGAALILNYHTAYFSLRLRGRLAEGERVLVHGAAGGVGTAASRWPRAWARPPWWPWSRAREGGGGALRRRRRGRAPTVPGASRSRS